jgi:hypothetical protein
MNNVKRANSTRTESFHVCDIGRAFTQLLAIAVMVFLAGALLSATSSAQSIPPPPATSSLIIKLSVGLSADEQAAVIAQCGGTETSTVPALRLHVVEVSADQRDQALANYQADPRVVRAELNKVRQSSAIPSDPFYSQQWALPRIGWDLVFGNSVPGGSVTVAVLDTGIEASHADLFGNVIPGTSILDGSDGLADPSGHGTMVAGTIAARTDTTPTEGIAGVAYAGVRLMPVTVLNADGLGQDSDVIAGVIWAVDNGANVIVMAFSNPGFSDSLQEAIDYAWSNNVVLVAAAGNDALGTPTYPAGDRGVIGVSATDENDQLASFSNYGPSVFLAAPGTNILTTDIGGTYLAINGTSSSAAIVAGAAAQLMAIDPTRSNGVIVGRLARNADPAGTQDQTGNGRINLARALTDTATDFIEPTGAAPFGPGGPFVGPYTAAAFTLTLTPNTGAPGTSVTATTGGGPFDKSATDIGIYWDGTLNTTNGTLVATCSVNSGGNLVAGCTFIVPSASAGTHTVVATQKSSTGKSVSATFTVTTASTSVTAAAASGVYGGTVNLSATLKSGTTAISGKTISFTLNGNGVGSATTNASGVATLSNVSLGSINAGNYITGVGANFTGDSGFLASSGTAALTVAQAASSTTETCPASVTYTSLAQTPCSATVSGAGLSQALIVNYSNNVNAGTATASATFGGDTNHSGSSDSKNFTIAQASSTTAIVCPASVTYTGSTQTPCSASVTGVALTQTLTVTYSNNVNAGTATASATFADDANHTGSTDSKTFTIDKAASSTSVSSSKNPATADDNVSFTATVTSGATGTVRFVVDYANYGSPVALTGGVATIAFTDKTAGTHTVSATYLGDANYNGNSGSLSPNQVVTAGAPAALAFGVQPTDTQAGQAITPAVTLRVLDSAGNLVTTDSSSVTIAISTSGMLQGTSTTSVPASGGVATFNNLKPTKAGSFTLHATDGTLTAADSTSFNVTPGAAVTFAFDVPASISAGQSFDITVDAKDAFNNTATGYTGVIHFTSSDLQAMLPSDTMFTAADGGVRTIAGGTILKMSGNQTITATDTVATSPSITGTSASVLVNPGDATVLVVSAPAAIETAGVPFDVTVKAQDAYGNTATGYVGPIHFTITDPKADPLGDYTFVPATDKGIHTFSATLHSAGQWTVKATDVPLSFYGVSGTITVQPGPLAKLAFQIQPGNTFVGVAIPDFEIAVEDADDNVVTNSGVGVTIALGNNPTGAAVLSGTPTVNAINGVATFSGLGLNKAASGYTLKASSGTLTEATSNSFDVGKGTATLSLGNLSQTYDGSPKSATVTTTPAGLSGVSVTYDGSSTAPTNAGSYAVIASLDNPDYQATNATGTLVIDKATSTTTVTFENAPYTYRATAFTATAAVTGVGGLNSPVAVVYTGDCTNVTTANGCTATATFAGDTNHLGSTDNKSITITKATSTTTVTFENAPYSYRATAFTATAAVTGVGGLNSQVAVIYSGECINVTTANGCTATATFAGDANHDGSSDHKSITITKAGSTTAVTFEPAPYIYRATAFTATAAVTGVGGLASPVTVVYIGDCINVTAANGCTATAMFAGDGNHDVSTGSKSVTITQAASATMVSCPASVTYNGSAQTPCTASVSGAGGLSQAPTPTYSNNTNAGTAVASYTYPGDGNHTGSLDSKNFTIAQAGSATMVSCPASVTYNGGAQTPCLASVSGVGGLGQPLMVSYTANVNAGTAAAGASYAGDPNHTGSANSATFTINKKDASVTPNNRSMFANDPDATSTITGTLSGFVVTDGVTPSYVRDPGSTAGSYTISAVLSPAGILSNYNITYNTASFIITDVVGPTGPLAKGASASLNVNLFGVTNAPSCTVDWNDGATTGCTDSHVYASAGVYSPKVTLKDGDGGSTSRVFQYVVIYDAGAGFVTGGGWINSPAGAYVVNPSLVGKANFGFVSKYQKGANVPSGDTEFQFQAASFNFKSTVYEWLVIAGAKAQYKGSGTINGSGDYGFMLTAIDGSMKGGGGADTFRLKVWNKATGISIYDNQLGVSDTADPTTALGGGSIVIHN